MIPWPRIASALAPLTKPTYVLRMAVAQRRPWRRRAQEKHLRLLRDALHESLLVIETLLDEDIR